MTLETIVLDHKISQVATEPRGRLLPIYVKLVLHLGLLTASSDSSFTLGYKTTFLD